MLLAGPVAAEAAEVALRVRVDIVAVTQTGSQQLGTSPVVAPSAVDGLLSSGQGTLLESQETLVLAESRHDVLMGRKDPVIYFDPRAGQYQVVYVDTGLKLSTAASSPRGLETRLEASKVDRIAQRDGRPFPETTVLLDGTSTIPATMDGKTMVFGQVSGPAARDTVQAMGGPAGFAADSIVTLVTVTKVR